MGIRRPDGSVLWISVNAQPIFEPGSPRPTLAVATFTDVTSRKETEARLRESEDRYRSLVEHAPIGIGVHQHGRFVYANARLASMLGAAGPADLIGLPIIDTVHPDWRERVLERIRAVTENGEFTPTIEERLIGLDGRILDVEVVGTACTYRGQPGIQVALLDTTERKRLQSHLLQSQKMEAVGRLASGVAHEFGNLLTAITGYAALAKRTLSPNHPAVQALNRVQEAAEQAAGVTGSLLTFGRRSGGDKSPVALMEPAERAARLLKRTLPAAVELVLRSEGPVWVMADVNQIQQAVVNLALNARDAMQGPAGGRLEIRVGPAPGGEGLAQVRVGDTGQGMSPEVLARVFEPFFTTKAPGEGTGLGMAIVQRIAEDHGGRVEVSSHLGEGTTVTMLLPRIAPPVEPGPSAAAPGAGHGRTVLLAGAARHARELMAGALIDMGCTVVQAADGPGLMERRAALASAPALLIVSAALPGRSGVECLAALRRAGDRTPAIVVCETAREGEGLDERSTPLVEPFPMSEMVAIAAGLLGAPRGGEEGA
jgi:PAS domain S-box-containing protein